MKILAFIGMPGAGKSEAAKLAKKMGIPVINMGDVVRKEANKLGLPQTSHNLGNIGTNLRKKEGMDAIAKRCIPEIITLKSNIIVIDGIRNIEEINCFKNKFGKDFQLISIDSPFDIRLKRIKKRGRSDDDINQLKKRDEREKQWGLYEAIKTANITIVNTGSIKEFRMKIKELLNRTL